MVYGRGYVFSVVIFIWEGGFIKFIYKFFIDQFLRKLGFRGVIFEFLEICWLGSVQSLGVYRFLERFGLG